MEKKLGKYKEGDFIINRDAGDIVGRIVAVVVIFDFEVIETDSERQMVKAHVAREILICRYSLTQRTPQSTVGEPCS